MDNNRPIEGLLLEIEEQVRDKVVPLRAGDVEVPRGELPEVVEDLQHACKRLGVLMPQFSWTAITIVIQTDTSSVVSMYCFISYLFLHIC